MRAKHGDKQSFGYFGAAKHGCVAPYNLRAGLCSVREQRVLSRLAAAAPTPAVLVWGSRHFYADSLRMSHDLYNGRVRPSAFSRNVLQYRIILLRKDPDGLVNVAA